MQVNDLRRKLFQIKFIHPLLLIIIVIAVYFPILGNDFIYLWDDQWMVVNDYTESGWTWKNLLGIFTEYYNGQYSPFTELNYLILYTFFGYNPFWFHLASILWHIGCVLLVYKLVVRIPSLNRELPHQTMRLISFCTALLFAVHPLNVESVAWVSAVKAPMYAFFYLWASIVFLNYIQTGKPRYYVLTMVLFTCSFLAKEQAVVFPVWLILIYISSGYKLSDKKVWVSTFPFFLMAIFFGIITMLSQSASGAGVLSSSPGYPLWQRVVFAFYAFFEYLIKGLFPFNLSYIYPFPSVIGDPLPQWLLIYPLLFVLMTVCTVRFFKYFWVMFGTLFFTIHIAITLHIIPMSRFAIVADRYIYLPYIGLALILSYGLILIHRKASRVWKTGLTVFFAGYIFFMGIYANQRTYTWHNSDTLKKELRETLHQRSDDQLLEE